MTVTESRPDVDAVVIGAGFAGLGAAHRLREQGLSVRGFEAAGGVGGTWYWNRYPGARTDSKAFVYCFTFSKEIREEWNWSELYPTQPEVLAYLEYVADRLELRPLFTFDTSVTRLTWDDDTTLWTVETDRGDRVVARYVLTGVGVLSAVNYPQIDGIDSYTGPIVHTARWPRDGVDVTGKRVAIIGSGSSGCRSCPSWSTTPRASPSTSGPQTTSPPATAPP
jgi:cation diffusion facilitator CzcD-associated flavoprotein CzcO